MARMCGVRHAWPNPITDVAALMRELTHRRGRTSAWETDLLPASVPNGKPAIELFGSDNPLLGALIQTYAQRRHTDRRIAASQLWKAYCYWLALPAIAGWVHSRRVADVAADNIEIRMSDSAPHVRFGLINARAAVLHSDPAAARPDTITAASEDELFGFLLHRLIDDHLFPALIAFRERSGIGNRILWGSVAVALTHPFSTLTSVTGRDLSDDLNRVVRELGPVGRLVEVVPALVTRTDASGTVVYEREPRPLRKTCCQKMRIPGERNCVNCPLLSQTRRDEISAAEGITWLPPLETGPMSISSPSR